MSEPIKPTTVHIRHTFDPGMEYPKQISKLFTSISKLVPFWNRKKLDALGVELMEIQDSIEEWKITYTEE